MFFGNNHGSKLKQKTRSSSTRAHTDFCAEITALGPDQLDSNSRILADSAYHSVDDDEKYVVEGCSTSSSADEENFIQSEKKSLKF